MDIVKRLKAKPPKGFVTSPLMIEAADEIERLRGQVEFERASLRSAFVELKERDNEIERLRDELDTWMSVFPDLAPESVLPDRSNLEKEIERLRETLRRIANDEEGLDVWSFAEQTLEEK